MSVSTKEESFMEGFIGIHLGAGHHSQSLHAEYRKLIQRVCRKAVVTLKNGGSAVKACAEATAMLEDSPLTNAGFGSNLTWGGEVECDASVMDGDSLHYGAVGAVPGVKNPVLLAKRLCESQKIDLPLGRVPPSFLVGEGAKIFAQKCGVPTVQPRELIAAQSWKLYQHYRRKVKKFNEQNQVSVAGSRLDTVGALCIDSRGHVAAACSSGGIALKTSGRVGQAAVYASGVWAQDAAGGRPAVAACTTGCGEHLIRTMLAKEAAFSVINSNRSDTSLYECMKEKFLDAPSLRDVDEKMGGIFVLKCNPVEDFGELLWSHSTNTMFLGYMSTLDSKPTCRLSYLTDPRMVGKNFVVEGMKFKCQKPNRKRSASSDVANGEDSNDSVCILRDDGTGNEDEDDDDDEEEEDDDDDDDDEEEEEIVALVPPNTTAPGVSQPNAPCTNREEAVNGSAAHNGPGSGPCSSS